MNVHPARELTINEIVKLRYTHHIDLSGWGDLQIVWFKQAELSKENFFKYLDTFELGKKLYLILLKAKVLGCQTTLKAGYQHLQEIL